MVNWNGRATKCNPSPSTSVPFIFYDYDWIGVNVDDQTVCNFWDHQHCCGFQKTSIEPVYQRGHVGLKRAQSAVARYPSTAGSG
jgi:hypothetical protein